MKRELKAMNIPAVFACVRDTEPFPMKRELKDNRLVDNSPTWIGYRTIPYEEGTESGYANKAVDMIVMIQNHSL